MGSCYADKVLKVAHDWVGYHEGSNNWTIFAKVLDEIHYFNGPKQNVAWCGTFDYFCILQACIPEDRDNDEKKWDALYFTYQPSNTANNLACACRYGADYFRQNNAWYSVKETQKGDIIFFGPYGAETHQGLVDYVKDGRVYTVEGNKGDEVKEWSYDLDDDYISGVGRPRYDGIYDPSNVSHEPADEDKQEPPVKEDKKATEYRVCVGSFLNIRNGHGTDYKKIGELYDGAIVLVYEIIDGWAKIGVNMWVAMDYLDEI